MASWTIDISTNLYVDLHTFDPQFIVDLDEYYLHMPAISMYEWFGSMQKYGAIFWLSERDS